MWRDELRIQIPVFSSNVALVYSSLSSHIISIYTVNSGSYNVTAVLIKQTFLTIAPLIMLLLSTGVVNRIHSGETELV